MQASSRHILIILSALIAIALIGLTPAAALAKEVPAETVTPDGWTLEGELHLPNGVTNPPVLILVHMYGKDRRDFTQLIPYYLTEGFALLAIDLRGHGRSLRHEGGITRYGEFKSSDDQERMLLDVQSWLDWLEGRAEVKNSKVGILGGSIGGNIAFVSCGAFPRLKGGVALSASYNSKEILVGKSVEEGFKPHDMLYVAGENDPGAADSARRFDGMTSGKHRVEIVKGSDKHGVNVILAHEEAFRMTVEWFKDLLK